MLGPFLRDLRGTKRAEDVATALGVVKQAVYLWESDNVAARRIPTAANLQALLDLYGASPDDRLKAWGLAAAAGTVAEQGAA